MNLKALSLLFFATPAVAQELPIQDNSFLVEEAYNQEQRVVQHISVFSHPTAGSEWSYSFTQEWPVTSQTHQLGFTIPLTRTAAIGLGDVAINYRYQLYGSGETTIAFAPRLTLLLPTGSSEAGRGSGGAGVQVNLPFSAMLAPHIVAHSNAGVTYTPRAHDTFGNSAAASDLLLAQSVIWLLHPKLNLMLEAAWTRSHTVIGDDETLATTELLIAPGIRGAIDFASGLQVVPGVAFPFGVGDSDERQVLLYVSFEHPF